MSTFFEEVNAFAQEKILPYAEEVDQTSSFPSKAFEEIGKAGYLGLLIPEEYGGMGKGAKEYIKACLL